jgi:hypothetical protein
MATTTTNYGFDIPQSTDLVKDGATAIATLGQDIDTAMNTALGTKKAGMVLLNTTSFSGVASQSVDSLFSATYKNYRLILNVDTSTVIADNLRLRFRTATSPADITAANYQMTMNLVSYANVNTFFGASGQTALDTWNDSDLKMVMDIHNPFETIITSVNYSATGSARNWFGGGQYNATTSIGGLSIATTGTANLTGVLSVYGYNE